MESKIILNGKFKCELWVRRRHVLGKGWGIRSVTAGIELTGIITEKGDKNMAQSREFSMY